MAKKFVNKKDLDATLAAAFHVYCDAKNIYEEATIVDFANFCCDIQDVMEKYSGYDVYNSQSRDPFDEFEIIPLARCGTVIFENGHWGYIDILEDDEWLFEIISYSEDGIDYICEFDMEEWLETSAQAWWLFVNLRARGK